jgi:hypothetical protein
MSVANNTQIDAMAALIGPRNVNEAIMLPTNVCSAATATTEPVLLFMTGKIQSSRLKKII